ncbi:Dynein heavy chain 9, axonemal [Takifugu flavidus]|uniref:Dynein heavy chain 9, axonemal n=1 Tax=Takifugu flavidus TaxID=433684 RepID=A0A5C6PQG6_9TELE|nr:Dynein heavy chain 9, axonemal [Takifugu flavidus]
MARHRISSCPAETEKGEKRGEKRGKGEVGGLALENVRWAEAVENFRKQEKTLCGDVLLITAFISYLGYFTKHYRVQLMDNIWKPYLSQLKRSVHPYCLPGRLVWAAADEQNADAWEEMAVIADLSLHIQYVSVQASGKVMSHHSLPDEEEKESSLTAFLSLDGASCHSLFLSCKRSVTAKPRDKGADG